MTDFSKKMISHKVPRKTAERLNDLLEDRGVDNETLILYGERFMPANYENPSLEPIMFGGAALDYSMKEFWFRKTPSFILFHTPIISITARAEIMLEILEKFSPEVGVDFVAENQTFSDRRNSCTVEFILPVPVNISARTLEQCTLSKLLSKMKKILCS